MPKGSPSAQTIATEKYAKRVGLMAKTYKLKREIVEDFAEACEKRGVSQAGELMKFMQQFVKETNQLE